LLAAATMWGCTWPQNKYPLSLPTPLTARRIPNLLDAGFAFAVAPGSRENMCPPRGEWRWVLIYGVQNSVAFSVFTTISVVWLDESGAMVITYTLPVWASLLAWPMLGERLTLRHVTAIASAFGVALLVGSTSARSALSKLPGVLRGFAAAAAFRLGTVVAKERTIAMPPVAGVAWQAFFGTLLVAAVALFEHPDRSRLNMSAIAIFGWTAVMPLTVACLTWFPALRCVPASLAATTVLLSPTIGIMVLALVLGEPFGPRQVVALVLTPTGVAMAATG